MNDTGQGIEERIRGVGIIPILRRMPETAMMALADAIIAGGAEAMEITLDSPGALDAISRLRARFGDRVLVGAGTLMNETQLREAVRAGSQFFLSPHLDACLVRAAHEAGQVLMPGVLTPSEIVQAEQAGARLLKLFPAGAMGVPYLKDLLGPFHGRAFFPTGGVTPDNAADFIRAGAVGLGMGSALLGRDDVEHGDWERVTGSVRTTLERVRGAKQNLSDRAAARRNDVEA